MVSDNKIFQDFQYLMPTKIIFKTGGISELTSLSIQLGTKPFIVTGRQSSKKKWSLRKIKEYLY